MRARAVWCGLLLIGVAGCSPVNREQLTKEVLKADPEFAMVLDKRRELSSRIETLKQELALKRTTINQKIGQLRKDLSTAAANGRAKTNEVKQRIEPDRQRLQLALTEASNELRVKREQRAELGRRIAQARKALKSATALPVQEQAARETQLNELVRDAGRLDQEMIGIKAHLRLLKVKLLLIKL